MADQDRPQITLITPAAIDLDLFPDRLAAVLDSADIACVRLALAGKDEDMIQRAADACRLVSHARDVAIVIENHVLMVERLGLDGVHLTDLHVWRVGQQQYACVLSLLMVNPLPAQQIRERLAIHEELVHVTIEIASA